MATISLTSCYIDLKLHGFPRYDVNIIAVGLNVEIDDIMANIANDEQMDNSCTVLAQ